MVNGWITRKEITRVTGIPDRTIDIALAQTPCRKTPVRFEYRVGDAKKQLLRYCRARRERLLADTQKLDMWLDGIKGLGDD